MSMLPSLWSSLPEDVFSKCILFVEEKRVEADCSSHGSWTWTLRQAASVCRSWRRGVLKHLQRLAPRCCLAQLPRLTSLFRSVQVLDLKKCKPWRVPPSVSDPVADFTASADVFSELRCLSSLPQLKTLEIRHINDSALETLSRCTALEALHLGGYLNLTATGVEMLTKLAQLTRLEFDGDGVLQTEDYHFLSTLHQLEALSLQKCSMSDHGLQFLSGLTKLKVLRLASCKGLRGGGFQYLSTLTRLQLLDVSSTEVTDEAFVHLRNCKDLTFLIANFCHLLMPQGFVQYLSALPLQNLRVMRCDALTLESALELKQKLKNCQICFQKSGDVFQEPVLSL